MAWVSPTGHNDPDGVWNYEEWAYDDDTESTANAFSVGAGKYLELTRAAIYCNKVRIWADEWLSPTHYNPDIDIDVYYGDGWHNIWSGVITGREWIEKSIGSTQLVTKAQVKFNTAGRNTYRIYEFDFNKVSEFEIDLQVGANLDDVHEKESDGSIRDYDTVHHRSNASDSYRYWGAHRWVSAGLPNKGDTIDVAYAELHCPSTLNDDVDGYWHFQKAASPARFTTSAHNVTGRTRTSASTRWDVDDLGTGWKETPSLKVPLQEVIDNYSPTAIVLIFRPQTIGGRILKSDSHNEDPALAAKLHIEWTAAAVADHKRAAFFQMF